LIVHVVLTNQFKPENLIEVDIKNCVCAVIDVIRATSTIAAILGNGGKKIIITGNKKEAFKFKKIYYDYILCGEEGGLPPEGFDYGNSPLEISNLDIKNRNFIMMTTNGTQSFFKVEKCKSVFSLSILNLKYTLDCVLDKAKESGSDILFLCSGEKGKIAYDDAFVAGLAIKYLLSQPYNLSFTDTSKLVLSTAVSENDIVNALEKSYSAQSLRSIGLDNDIYFCSRLDKYKVAAVLNILKVKKLVSKYKRSPKILSNFNSLLNSGTEAIFTVELYKK
jgi:2-phosphosulfolactate phosphatase